MLDRIVNNIEEFSTQKPLIAPKSKSITLAGLKSLSMIWLFPGLISALVVGPQPWAHPLVGQMIVMLNDIAAGIIIIATFRGSLWPLGLIMSILLAKTLSLISVSGSAELLYIILVGTLLFIAGAIIAFERSKLVYKQLMIICSVSVLFMVLQSAGVGGFSQFLATSYYDYEVAPDVQNTLFAPLADIAYDVRVFRPAGLLRTGTLVSLVILFALPLHLSKHRGRIPGGTAVLCAMVVLSMGKIVFVGFIVVVLFILVKGNRRQQLESIKTIAFLLFFLLLYSFFFPGLFEHNLGTDTQNFSIFVRLNDILEIFPEGTIIREMADPYMIGTVRKILPEGDHLSGIPSLIMILPYLGPFLVILSIYYFKGYNSMRVQFPDMTLMCGSIFFGIILYPAVFPIWDTGLYWFMLSFALLPIYFKLFPRYFRKKTPQYSRETLMRSAE